MDVFDTVRIAAQKAVPLGRTKYLHASAILSSKGKVLSVGRNHYRGDIIEGDDGPIERTVHSEIHALYQVNVRRLSGATIINYACSTGVYGGSVISRPCDTCYRVLRKLGFKKMFYSIHSEDRNAPKWKEELF